MATGTGMYNVIDYTPQDLLAKSFGSAFIRLFPNGSAPLFGLTSMLQDKTAVQFEHGFFTKTMVFPSVKLNGAILAADTTFTVDTTADILPNMIIRPQTTGENILVKTVISSTQILVQRAVGTVAAADIADDVNLYCVGNAHEEGSVRPVNQFIIPARVTNYTQIFRNSWQLTGTALASDLIAGDGTVAENRQDCMHFHAADIEKALFFGQKFLGTLNNNPFHTMHGLIPSIVTYASGNVTTLGGTTNWTQLEAAVNPVWNQNTDPKFGANRVMFVGGDALRVINSIARLNGTYQLVDGQTNFGLQFSTLKMPRGTLRLIEHPLFNTNADWIKMGVVVDMSNIKLVYLRGRKTQSREYNMAGTPVDDGIDAVGGTLTTEMTMEIQVPSANAVLYNFTAGAAG